MSPAPLAPIEFIETEAAPIPLGHYSQAVVHNDIVYVSGQLPVMPGQGATIAMPEGIEAQTRQALENLRHIVQAAGSGIDRILSVTVYIPDVNLWPGVNAVYAEFMGAHRPARTVVPTAPLHHGALIEIAAIAARR